MTETATRSLALQNDGERDEDADWLVLSTQKEEFYAEHIFMIGAGVNRGRIARGYSETLFRRLILSERRAGPVALCYKTE